MGFLERFLSSVGRRPSGGLLRSRRRATLRDQIETWARRHGDRVALKTSSEQTTFQQWNMRANRYARWARNESLQMGDVVGFASPDMVEAMCAWAGLTKAGVTLALLDCSSSAEQLSAAIEMFKAGRLIADAALLKPCAEACDHLDQDIPIYGLGEATLAGEKSWPRLAILQCGYSGRDIPFAERTSLSINETCLLTIENIVDSAPCIRGFDHRQIEQAMGRIVSISGLRKHDRLDVTNAASNSAETFVAMLAALSQGATCVLADGRTSGSNPEALAKADSTIFVATATALRQTLANHCGVELPKSLRAGLIVGLTPELAGKWKAAFSRIPLHPLSDIG